MTYLVAWTHPEGSGYSSVQAESMVDACRQLRYMLPEFAARLKVIYVAVS